MKNINKSRKIAYEDLKASNQAYFNELEEAVSKVIRSGWFVLGNEVSAFETEFSEYVGAKYCVGVGNGLDALTLSLEALELESGSEILVASNTYIATILAIIRAGLRPVLVEPDIDTYNIDPSRLEEALTDKTQGICVTHMFGKACRMDLIVAFARKNSLRIVEDCAQSHGAKFAGKVTGSFGDAGCFSFYPTKNLGAIGDAGAVVTDDDVLADRIRHLRNYGSKKKYVNEYVGINSRLDEIQAAILRVKLRHLPSMTEHKRNLANIYYSELPGWLSLPRREDHEYDVFHIFSVRHAERDALRDYLNNNNIQTEMHYPIPPHRQKAMKDHLAGTYPIADSLHATELSLPISYGHSAEDIIDVCEVICAAEDKFGL